MATTISTQDLIDVKRDIDDVGKAVNENVIVSPRYGEDFKSLPMIAAEAQATIGGWESAIALITQEGGIPALAVSDASGKTQQEVNDLAINGLVDYYRESGDTSDAQMFQRLVETNPTKIALTPNKEYDLGTTLITLPVGCVVEGNGAKIKVSGNNVGLTPRPMLRTRLTALSEKGTRVISVTDTTGFNVGDIIHLYIGADTTLNADPYYAAIQYDESDVGYTGQMNAISAIDTVNKTVTLQNDLLYKTSNKGYLQKVYTDSYHFKDLTIEHDGQTSPALYYNYVCNFFTTNVSYTNPNGGVKGVSPNQTFNLVRVVHQSSFNCHHLKPYIGKAVCMHFNHGTVNGSVSFGNIDAHYFSDGGIVMYAGPVNILSYRNNFKFHTLTLNGALATDASAVYFGAKCRDCTSDGDTLDGFFSGYRGYFGSYNATVKNGTTKNSRGSTLQFVGAYDLNILNNNLDYSGFLRYCPRAKIRFNSIENPNFIKGVTTAPSYALQITPKLGDLVTAQVGLEITDNPVMRGGVSITVGLEDFKIAGNTDVDLLSLYMAQSYCKLGKIYNNNTGGITLRSPTDVEVYRNNINDTPLRAFTNKRTGGIVTSGSSVIDINNNRIVSETAGIFNETTNRTSEVAIRTDSNNIIAGTVKRTNRITSALPPILSVDKKDVFAIGTKFYTDEGNGYWELTGWGSTSATFEYYVNNEVDRRVITLGSFPPVANGVFEFAPITNITGLNTGDLVHITGATTPLSRGYFSAEVTNTNTLQIRFHETQGIAEIISAQSGYLYINKIKVV